MHTRSRARARAGAAPTSPGTDAAPAARAVASATATAASASAAADVPHATYAELLADKTWSYLADNDAVLTGYRYRMTPRRALASICSCHNEVCARCTAVWPCLLFLATL